MRGDLPCHGGIMLSLDISIWVKVAIACFAFLGIMLFIMGIQRIWRRRIVAGSLEGLMGLLFLAVATLMVMISVNLYTYDRLTHESKVAEISFQEIGPQHFATILKLKNKAEILDLRGDEWQIDARVLKWRGMAVLFGFDTLCRLDRLSGRYREIHQERTAPRTVYSLSEGKGLDLWLMAKKYKRWIPWVDALYGSASYMPMVDGASYTVFVSLTGLLARPNNDIALKAVSEWR
jgi:hypothetical protein